MSYPHHFALWLAVLMMIGVPALASPTVWGPTGLLLTPTADVPGTVKAQLGAWFVDDVANSVALDVGIGSGLEATGAWVDPDGGDSEPVLSAKWRFRQDSLTRPAIAVGIMDIGDRFDVTPYIVVQKDFEVRGYGLATSVGVAAPNSLLDGFFAGAAMKVGGKYRIMAEYDGDDINAGVRFPWRDRIEITAGLVRDGFAASATFKIR
ncbi:MAG: hypothetical protein ACUVX8_11455 [Candidatus Zipacnadales bacterium]